MKTVDFSELNNIDYAVYRIVPVYQHWHNNDVWSSPPGGRPNSALMYFSNCATSYILNGKSHLVAHKGDLAYLPYKSEYSCKFFDCLNNSKKESSLIINFELFDDRNEPFVLDNSIRVIKPGQGTYYYESFKQAVLLFYESAASYNRIRAMLYNLLTDVALEVRRENLYGRSITRIYKGIDYIEHNFTSDLSIPELASMCHVSETCFRRLFRLYAGMPPKEYINHLRISKARVLLESGTVTVADTALALGFDDASYFSRLYKNKTGSTPSSRITGPK
ncbi:MAG: AraC family transcriptional regulator [Eubacteriales bacterium]|nr:AraC family transcriptional regulator [Eubacteriales bacterium]